jgi:death-on-curing protein
VDGNKRTGAAAMLAFLELNGYELSQTDDEIAEVFEGLGRKVIDQGEFFGWILNHARLIDADKGGPAMNNS